MFEATTTSVAPKKITRLFFIIQQLYEVSNINNNIGCYLITMKIYKTIWIFLAKYIRTLQEGVIKVN